MSEIIGVGLSEFLVYDRLQLPIPNPLNPPVVMATQVPINPYVVNMKIRPLRIFSMERLQRWEGFLNEMDDCVYFQRKNLAERDKCYYFGRCLKDGSPVDWFSNLKQTHSSLLNDFTTF